MSVVASLVAPLFVPANRPDRFAKAAASGADAIIFDLEDAIPAEAKDSAREALREVLVGDLPVIVRINGAGSRWHQADCALLAQLRVAAVMLPKAERVDDLERLGAMAPVIALIETAAGMAEARALARSGLAARIAFGSIDYASDIGCDHVHEALAGARAELVLASRLGSLPAPIDGVSADLTSSHAASDDARAARTLGFGGKLVIHPNQVQAVKDAFRPSDADVAWAERVLATGDGAVRLNGAMVDEPVRIRARAILARAGMNEMADKNRMSHPGGLL